MKYRLQEKSSNTASHSHVWIVPILFFSALLCENANADSLLHSLPDWSDEQAAYEARGLATSVAHTDIVDRGFSSSELDNFSGLSRLDNTHNDTEGDPLWVAFHMHKRLDGAGGTKSSAAGYWLTRRENLAAWFKSSYYNGEAYLFDRNNYNLDHLYGWGLADYYEETGDSAALTALNNIQADAASFFSSTRPGTRQVSSYYFDGPRRWARQLRFAARLTEVAPTTANRTWRDKVVDIVLQDPGWDSTYKNYWYQDNGDTGIDYSAGDRNMNTFHIGVLMESLFIAWRSLTADGDTTRANNCAQRLIDLATFYRDIPLDANGFLNLRMGRNISNGSAVATGGRGTPYGVYTIPPINGLVFAYKFTGTQSYLDRAWQLWNNWQASTYWTGRGGGPAQPLGTVHHYTDSLLTSSEAFRFLDNNKGELQYTYALFENGGRPALLTDLTKPQPPSDLVVQ